MIHLCDWEWLFGPLVLQSPLFICMASIYDCGFHENTSPGTLGERRSCISLGKPSNLRNKKLCWFVQCCCVFWSIESTSEAHSIAVSTMCFCTVAAALEHSHYFHWCSWLASVSKRCYSTKISSNGSEERTRLERTSKGSRIRFIGHHWICCVGRRSWRLSL